MKIKNLWSMFIVWLKSPEMFGRATDIIQGKWVLFEYYMDIEENLINVKENELIALNQLLEIEFFPAGRVEHNCKVPVPLLQNLGVKKWKITKSKLSVFDPIESDKFLSFRFAFEKGNLKLLKKDAKGKIEFFGFFRRNSCKTE